MKLKGMRKLEKQIGKLVKEIDNTIVFKIGSEDMSIISQNKVFFSILRGTMADIMFRNNLNDTYPDAPNRSTYFYSLLHEIGHIRTKEEYYKEDTALRQTAMATGNNKLYFSLPAEKAATQWAVEYTQNNYGKTLTLDRKINYYIRKFIDKNMG